MEKSNKLSRRDFLKMGLLGLGAVALGGEIAAFQKEEIAYQLEKSGEKEPSEKPATALLVDTNTGVFGGGTFITSRHILTAAHLKVNELCKVITGKNYLENFNGKKYCTGILKISELKDLDLAVVTLSEDQVVASAAMSPSVFAFGDYEATTTLAATHKLVREETYAGRKFSVVGANQYKDKIVGSSYIVTENSCATQGDSGTGLYLEETNELIGVSVGGNTRLFGLRPNSYFVNITNPEIRAWVSEQCR